MKSCLEGGREERKEHATVSNEKPSENEADRKLSLLLMLPRSMSDTRERRDRFEKRGVR